MADAMAYATRRGLGVKAVGRRWECGSLERRDAASFALSAVRGPCSRPQVLPSASSGVNPQRAVQASLTCVMACGYSEVLHTT